MLEAHFTVKIGGAEITLTRPVQESLYGSGTETPIRPLAVVLRCGGGFRGAIAGVRGYQASQD